MEYRRAVEEALGYHLPRYGDCHDAADPEILRRLSENDNHIIANNRTWLEEVGRVISKSTLLRSLSIEIEDMHDAFDGFVDEFDPITGLPSLIWGLLRIDPLRICI